MIAAFNLGIGIFIPTELSSTTTPTSMIRNTQIRRNKSNMTFLSRACLKGFVLSITRYTVSYLWWPCRFCCLVYRFCHYIIIIIFVSIQVEEQLSQELTFETVLETTVVGWKERNVFESLCLDFR